MEKKYFKISLCSLCLCGSKKLTYLFSLFIDVIVEHILAQVHDGSKIGLASPYLCYLFNKIYQVVIIREHKSIDKYARFAAGAHLFQCFLDDHRIETHGVFVEITTVVGALQAPLHAGKPARR